MTLVLQASGPLTYDELQGMPDDGHRYELLDGVLHVTPSPVLLHQRCVPRLWQLLDNAHAPGIEVLPGPVDWYVTPTTYFVPDVIAFRSEDAGPQRIERPPLLVAEVLSPSTRGYDLLIKRDAYAQTGAPWYWIVDPDEPSVTVLRLVDGEYREHACASGDTLLTVEDPFAVSLTPSQLVAPS